MEPISDKRLDECINLWRRSLAVPDFEFDEALRMAVELRDWRKRIADADRDPVGVIAELERRAEKAESELAEARRERDQLHALKCDIGVALGEDAGPPFPETVSRLRRELDEAREMIDDYADHTVKCLARDTTDRPCSCGLTEALARWAKEE